MSRRRAGHYVPSWAPDGGTILHAVDTDRECALRTTRPDGSERARPYWSPVRFFDPSWSPKGDRIVLAARQTDRWDLWRFTLDRNGKNLARLVGADPGAPIFERFGN